MIVIGYHRFGLRKIAARKDFCSSCQRECVSEQWQSLDFGHFFWVPLLPLGKRKRWQCNLCGRDPRARTETRKSLRAAGLFVLPILLLSTFSISPADMKTEKEIHSLWAGRAIFGAAFAALLYSTLRPKRAVTDEQRRAAVTPLSSASCFYCHGPLKRDPDYYCPPCDIRIFSEPPSLPPPLPPA